MEQFFRIAHADPSPRVRVADPSVEFRRRGVPGADARRFAHHAPDQPRAMLGATNTIAHPVSIHRVDSFGVPSRYRTRLTRASSRTPPSALTSAIATSTQATSVALT